MQLNDYMKKFIGKVVVVRKRDEFKFAAKMIKITPAGRRHFRKSIRHNFCSST